MEVHVEDPRLKPILEKVEAGVRLSCEDGLALYRTSDILALGYMANLVRERMHGDTTYFHVNRHINPTDVCVASCRLCAFGKRADPKAYTMSLDQVWHVAGELDRPSRSFIVGGLHPAYAGLVPPEAARPERALSAGALKAFTMVEIGYFASGAYFDAGSAGAIARCRHGFAARRRCRNFLTGAAGDLRSKIPARSGWIRRGLHTSLACIPPAPRCMAILRTKKTAWIT
jgi:hypothetical protein